MPNRVKATAVCAVAIVVGSLVLWSFTAPTPSEAVDAPGQADWVVRTTEAVRSHLDAPALAQFRQLYVHVGRDDNAMACGEVSIDGVKFGRFVTTGDATRTYLSQQMSAEAFSVKWDRYCRG